MALQWVCDGCGKTADEQEADRYRIVCPDTWFSVKMYFKSRKSWAYVDACSPACMDKAAKSRGAR